MDGTEVPVGIPAGASREAGPRGLPTREKGPSPSPGARDGAPNVQNSWHTSIDAPVGKNLGTRRVAPLDSRQGMPKV